MRLSLFTFLCSLFSFLCCQGADVRKINPSTVQVPLSTESGSRLLTLDFYGPRTVRLFLDPQGGIVRDPQAEPPAKILVDGARQPAGEITLTTDAATGATLISSPEITVEIQPETALLSVTDRRTGRKVLSQAAPAQFTSEKTTLSLASHPGEYFYGGGVQNGRFSHAGKAINIVNENSWTDLGVCSPAPFYWSTAGYGLMWHTFAPGRYDFASENRASDTENSAVTLTHWSPYLDLFVMVDEQPEQLLNDYYQLTGHPVLLPKFGFYEGHLNAYNRDYWTPVAADDPKGILFEDGNRYRESQKDNGGIRETLNGEAGDSAYQFSARAVIDRYAAADMPLGWLLPNDGYGAGYGQTGSLEGNVDNLRQLGDYARSHGVEIGLWTQSDLHPVDSVEPLLQRDIVREVRDAGVRVLKTDVAWVGYGYSFGLNGTDDVAAVMPYYGSDARPFIISLDGWAGTQRNAAVWSGDQTGGQWEYIRFHIPTYVGAGLSGQPNITSDMDGIFGGANPVVNVRDFQWKALTPMQLNMDGWGANPKYPQALGEPYASLNRRYLKLKSSLLPYAYTYAREAVDGKPLIRAVFLDCPQPYAFNHAETTPTRYEYLFGPDLLVAPVYQNTAADSVGNDRRDAIYLPDNGGAGWVDYFTGQLYPGGRVINNFPAPLWKLPLFVRRGAIIPVANPSNNPSQIDRSLRIFDLYPGLPGSSSSMSLYDDDGTTQQYLDGVSATTPVEMSLSPDGSTLTVAVSPTVGEFDGMVADQRTELRILATSAPRSVSALLGGKKLKLTPAPTYAEFERLPSAYYFGAVPPTDTSLPSPDRLLVKLPTADTRHSSLSVTVKGYEYNPAPVFSPRRGHLDAPSAPTFLADTAVTANSLLPAWANHPDAEFYEIYSEADSMLYSDITAGSLLFDGLRPQTDYGFRLRAVNSDGPSDWTPFSARTLDNPLEWAIRGIKARSSVPDQDGFAAFHLTDFLTSGDVYHSQYGRRAVPSSLILDLRGVYTLDCLDYLPRQDAGRGTIQEATVQTSIDGQTWSDSVAVDFAVSSQPQRFVFADRPDARYVRLNVSKALNNYVSGREIFVYRVPGTEGRLQGDINRDGKLDDNDLTSYLNYMGLRRGDADWDYVSAGDTDGNGQIDARDLAALAVELDPEKAERMPDDGTYALTDTVVPVGGTIKFYAPYCDFAAGDEVPVVVNGENLEGVQALGLALPYDPAAFEFLRIEPSEPLLGTLDLTNDRLHTDGQKVLYPTFALRGVAEPPISLDSHRLMTIVFRARRPGRFTSRPSQTLLVGRSLDTKRSD